MFFQRNAINIFFRLTYRRSLEMQENFRRSCHIFTRYKHLNTM